MGIRVTKRGGWGIKANLWPKQDNIYVEKVIKLSMSDVVRTCAILTMACYLRIAYLHLHYLLISFTALLPPQWLLLHHFGGSVRCYGVRYFSLRGLGFTGYLLVSTLPPPPNHFLVWVPLLVESLPHWGGSESPCSIGKKGGKRSQQNGWVRKENKKQGASCWGR